MNTAGLRQGWADELVLEIKDEVWDECLKGVYHCSVNVRHNLIQFKMLHRLYYSREMLHTVAFVLMSHLFVINVSHDLNHFFWSLTLT